MTVKISGKTIVDVVKGKLPHKRFAPPLTKPHSNTNSIPDSINETIRYLAFCDPPFPGGILQSKITGGVDTVIWKILSLKPALRERTETTSGKDIVVRRVVVHTEFFINAHRNLLIHTYEKDAVTNASTRGTYKGVLIERLPKQMRTIILTALEEKRVSLVRDFSALATK